MYGKHATVLPPQNKFLVNVRIILFRGEIRFVFKLIFKLLFTCQI